MAERLATLASIEQAVWQELTRAARDKQHGWRTPVLATLSETSCGPLADARTVVVRDTDPLQRTLLIYTDARSAKATQIQHQPLGTLVMWSIALGWQLRCRVRLTLAEDGLMVSSRWARIKLSPAAQDYLSPLAPGTPLDDGPSPAGLAPRDSFAVITAQVDHIDWLELHADGHRRADFGPDGARWLQP
jgi:hypothetical protein